jgi:ABC-type molybdate transport system substrate-binding protein
VKAGNPLHIKSFDDLLRSDVRLASANPEAAAIGRTIKKALGDRYTTLAAKIAVLKPTVTEIASDVQIGAADAAIVWDSTVPQFKGTEAIDLPEFANITENATAAVLAHSQQAPAALKFARYLAAPEKGGEVFKKCGFTPVGGDKWAAMPELILYSGSVNRVALEPLLRAFADREGIKVTTVFNGCGILCASMKSMQDAADPRFPDAYYACDLCFVPPVAKQFPQTLVLTETEIGIVVQKDNPKQIQSAADLAKPGLRVGLCNAEQSTLGYMTSNILTSSGLDAAVRKNVAVEAPTADFLINQMRAGALDAAIVYRVNAQLQSAHLDFVKIDHPGALARQPFSIRRGGDNRYLAGRLLEHLKNHRAEFEKAGFTWRGDGEMVRSDSIDVPQWLRTGRGKLQ